MPGPFNIDDTDQVPTMPKKRETTRAKARRVAILFPQGLHSEDRLDRLFEYWKVREGIYTGGMTTLLKRLIKDRVVEVIPTLPAGWELGRQGGFNITVRGDWSPDNGKHRYRLLKVHRMFWDVAPAPIEPPPITKVAPGTKGRQSERAARYITKHYPHGTNGIPTRAIHATLTKDEKLKEELAGSAWGVPSATVISLVLGRRKPRRRALQPAVEGGESLAGNSKPGWRAVSVVQ